MAKKITAVVKIQLPAGKATPGPPVGSSLGPHGINIAAFTKDFNDRTASQAGLTIPAVITIYQDRTFDFILKTPPTAVLIKKELGLETASGKPNSEKVGQLTTDQVKKIAEIKIPDLTAAGMDAAMSMVAGAARSMGVTVEGDNE